MHEFSVASAILELAERHVPPGATLRGIQVEAGPKRSIDPDAMRFAWQAMMQDRPDGEVKLNLSMLPWQLCCPRCGRQWTSAELYSRCDCGADESLPVGGDELRLVSVDVNVDEG